LKTSIRIIFFLLLFTQVCKANMSSPVWEGTMVSTVFSSKDIRILSELIHVKIDKDFGTATFLVEYTIQSEVAGKQIPLLFYAQDYKDNFQVWVDSQHVDVKGIPEKNTHIANSPFSGFSGPFKSGQRGNGADEVMIYWTENSAFVYKLNELKYFETDIAKGIHKIRVAYTATAWTDISGWVKVYSFRYSLTPAKFWKSFGTLRIVVEQEGAVKELVTNLGKPMEQQPASINSWVFTKLPAEYLELSYSPKVSVVAKALIFISPFGLALITGICLFALHLLLARRYRRKFVTKKYSPVVIAGSLVVPFLILLSYMYAYPLIDAVIGDHAGRRHGYIFLVLVLYPLFLGVYWLILWLFDVQQKRKLIRGQ
jgi:hypothetical protein